MLLGASRYVGAQTPQETPLDSDVSNDNRISEQRGREVDLLWTRPGCIAMENNSIMTVGAFLRYFASREGDARVSGVGSSALRSKTRLFLPEDSVTEGMIMTRFMEEVDHLTPEVLGETDFLQGPRETVLPGPQQPLENWQQIVENDFVGVDQERKTAIMRRYTLQNGERVLELDWSGENERPSSDILSYSRVFAVSVDLHLPTGNTRFFMIGRSWGQGARLAPELRALHEESSSEPLLIHFGNITPRVSLEIADFCASHARDMRPTLVLPRAVDLGYGPERIQELKDEFELPLVAANLRRANDDEPFLPPFVRVEKNGVDIALIGLVDPDQLDRASGRIRRQWVIRDPRAALEDALAALRDLPSDYPDLVIVVTSTSSGRAAHIAQQMHGVDIVMGELNRGRDLTRWQERIDISASTPRARSRRRHAIRRLQASDFSVGRIRFGFDEDLADGLRWIETEGIPISDEGPIHQPLFRQIRQLEEQIIENKTRVVLPDIDSFVRANPELQPLVFGQRILQQGRYGTAEDNGVAFMTDPFWMRFVTNILRSELDVDIAISRNLPRSSQTAGPIQRFFLDAWLQANDEAQVLTLSGATLRSLVEILEERRHGHAEPRDVIFVSGIDTQSGRVSGRTIVDHHDYQIAISDTIAAQAAISELLGDHEIERRGLIRDIVETRIARWIDPDNRSYDSQYDENVSTFFQDTSREIRSRWDFELKELSGRGAFYRNVGRTGRYAPTRETRLLTPSNLSIAARGDLGLVYDGPSVGWETRVQGNYQRVDLDLPNVSPQEAADDLLIFSELRLNAWELSVGESELPITPFFRTEFDSEFTATINPASGDTFPHQKLLRERLGLVLLAGSAVPEVRIGVLGQHDFSQGTVHDAGVFLDFKLAIPLGPLKLISNTSFRYHFEDADDRPIDLGMVLRSDNRLSLELSRKIALFVFADLFFARGKVENLQNIAGSAIMGLGLQFSGSWRL